VISRSCSSRGESDVDLDRLEGLAGGERSRLQFCHSGLELRIGGVALDRDRGGLGAAGEGIPDAVQGLNFLHRLRQGVEAGLRGVQVERRERQRDQHRGGGERRDERSLENAVEDRVRSCRCCRSSSWGTPCRP